MEARTWTGDPSGRILASMTTRTPARSLLLLFAAALAGGCATARNYLEPEGPRYTGGSGAPRAEAAGDAPLRVVTFNVEYGRRIAEAIAALRSDPLCGADVVTLQEMDAPGVQAIASALGMGYVYYPSSQAPQTGRDFGNAVLSPWPIESSHKVLLPGLSRGTHQARAAVQATLRIRGRAVAVYSVHLTSPWGMGGGGRARQVDAVLADAEGLAIPVLVAGDFNSSGIGKRFLDRGFLWPTRKVGHSIGLFSYDHVFVRDLGLHEEARAGVARTGPRASDHWPVWALLR